MASAPTATVEVSVDTALDVTGTLRARCNLCFAQGEEPILPPPAPLPWAPEDWLVLPSNERRWLSAHVCPACHDELEAYFAGERASKTSGSGAGIDKPATRESTASRAAEGPESRASFPGGRAAAHATPAPVVQSAGRDGEGR